MKRPGPTVLACLLVMLPALGQAALLDPGNFRLENHPDGGLAPPHYGLRLDGLDGNPEHEFTFDFEGPGAEMSMRLFPDWSLRIFGKAYGGLENGDSYVDPQLWSIDFTYVRMIVDGDQLVSDPTAGPNQGTIAALPAIPDLIVNTPETEPLDLVDYLGGNDSSFILALDHRGFTEVSGFGWLNHSPGGLDNHIFASDWLFTVVPEPGSLAWLGLGLVFLTRALRRPSLARGGRVRSLPGP